MRIDRVRLERGRLPFVCPVATRYSDVDVIGHVNNVAVAAIIQEGRNRFFHASKLLCEVPGEVVLAALNIEFANDLLHPEPIEVRVGVLEIGRTSFRLGQTAAQHGRIGAFAEVVLVARHNREPVPLPDVWRRILTTMAIVETPP